MDDLTAEEIQSLLAMRQRLLKALSECRNDCERAKLEAILYGEWQS